jgi:hypothetical protein
LPVPELHDSGTVLFRRNVSVVWPNLLVVLIAIP